MCDKSNEPAGPCPLLIDSMLGRLARWLRLLGYDALYAGRSTDHEIAARARAEGRIVLTRDRELAHRKGIRCLYIDSQDLEQQIAQVVAALGKPCAGTAPRCPRCNHPLVQVPAAEARPHVPAYVFETHPQFHYCPVCTRYYWPGSHWENIQSTFHHVLGYRTDE